MDVDGFFPFPCVDCGGTHPDDSHCPGCGACLHKNASQKDEQGEWLDPTHQHPVFRCTKCNKRVFWD